MDLSQSERQLGDYMCDRPWELRRDYWLLCVVTDEQLLDVVRRYAEVRPFDNHTILWLSSRGVKGYDAGIQFTEALAKKHGGYAPRNEAHDGCCGTDADD